jgi:hypothetical protein
MTSTKNILVAALLSLGLLGTAQASEQTMKPMQGVSFHAGTTHAVAYYTGENRLCKLVLTVAEEPKGDVATFEATRFEASLAAGRSTRYTLAKGKSLEFTCQTAAKTMNVKMLDAVAAN